MTNIDQRAIELQGEVMALRLAVERLAGGVAEETTESRAVFVTSPEERRRLREQLAASGDTLTRKFLAGLHPGGGGGK